MPPSSSMAILPLMATVTDSLVVVNGTATVNGTVGNDITVVSGDLVLNASAQVEDVMLVRSTITQDPAAVVSGDIEERDEGDFSLGRGFAVFSILAWLGLLILGIVAAIRFCLARSRSALRIGGNAAVPVRDESGDGNCASSSPCQLWPS